jgi:hypothetical protein
MLCGTRTRWPAWCRPDWGRLHGRGLSDGPTSFSRRQIEGIQSLFERGLGSFERHIGSVTVRVVDQNGPRGGCDLVCTVVLHMDSPGKHLSVTGRGETVGECLADARDRARRAVRRAVHRRTRVKRVPLPVFESGDLAA